MTQPRFSASPVAALIKMDEHSIHRRHQKATPAPTVSPHCSDSHSSSGPLQSEPCDLYVPSIEGQLELVTLDKLTLDVAQIFQSYCHFQQRLIREARDLRGQ